MARDRDLSGTWTWGDQIYFEEIPYASVAWTTPGTKTTDYPEDFQSLGRWRPALDDTTYTLDWPEPTTIRVLSQRFTSEDVFEFRTLPVGSAPGTVVGNDLKKVLAVPNPYYAHSQYELTQFDRVLKFTNIPVTDQDRALEFYTKKLGFRVITDSPFNDKQRWIELGIPRAETKLVLFTAPGQDKLIGELMNVTFSADDVAATAKELMARGVEFVQEPRKADWGTSAIFKDPDGNQFVLSTS